MDIITSIRGVWIYSDTFPNIYIYISVYLQLLSTKEMDNTLQKKYEKLHKKGRFDMIGTIANTAAILIGTTIGSTLKKGIKPQYQDVLFNAMGLAATGLGINAVVQNMPNSQYPVLFIASLAIGALLGNMLQIDTHFHNLTARFSSSHLGEGLSTAILLFCIGTLSIVGPIQSALYGDNTYLFTNATLDLVTSAVLASTYGRGIALAAGVLFCWQAAIYLCAGFLSSFLTDALMCEISILGGFLIASSGIAILQIKDLKTLNMLPALLVPPVFFACIHIFSRFM